MNFKQAGLRADQRSTLSTFQQQLDTVAETVATLSELVEESQRKQGSCAFVAAYLRPSLLHLQQSLDVLQRKRIRAAWYYSRTNVGKSDREAAWALRPNEGTLFGKLPESAIAHILSFLPPKSLLAFLLSSKYFHERWSSLLPKKVCCRAQAGQARGTS